MRETSFPAGALVTPLAQETIPAATVARRTILARLSGTLAPLSFLILLFVILSLTSPNFASRLNMKQLAVQAAVVAILACGQTAVIISGNIDLSVGAVMAFAGVTAAIAMGQHHVGLV